LNYPDFLNAGSVIDLKFEQISKEADKFAEKLGAEFDAIAKINPNAEKAGTYKREDICTNGGKIYKAGDIFRRYNEKKETVFGIIGGIDKKYKTRENYISQHYCFVVGEDKFIYRTSLDFNSIDAIIHPSSPLYDEVTSTMAAIDNERLKQTKNVTNGRSEFFLQYSNDVADKIDPSIEYTVLYGLDDIVLPSPCLPIVLAIPPVPTNGEFSKQAPKTLAFLKAEQDKKIGFVARDGKLNVYKINKNDESIKVDSRSRNEEKYRNNALDMLFMLMKKHGESVSDSVFASAETSVLMSGSFDGSGALNSYFYGKAMSAYLKAAINGETGISITDLASVYNTIFADLSKYKK
jgi:hypothetical protein